MRKFITVMAYIGVLTGVYPFTLQSQTLSPDQWESFISTNNTTLVSDTFRMQRFENGIQDNWSYIVEGNHSIIDASLNGLNRTNERKLMKLELNSSLHFSTVVSPLHQTVRGGLNYTGKNLMKGEHIQIILHEEAKLDTVTLSSINIDNSIIEQKHVKIGRTIYGIGLQVAKPSASTKNGYYSVDSVYLLGNIPAYSLFQGKSFWNDTLSWSHLPAERHRHALIKGQVSITSDTQCDEVSLNGSLIVEKGKIFSLKELNFFEASSTIKNEGELFVNDKINLTRTFPEKGKWYFVSFPFDVYADGIDAAFSLKDDKPNGGGNFIYVLSYNGEKRSVNSGSQSNWDVLPESVLANSSPVFEKNKGYLLAIDALADGTTIRFASRKGDIPSTFGKEGEISLDIPYVVDENSSNAGWYLCGNPLPAPLHVNELAHPSLDGNVYLFNGEDYTQIPVDGNYVLPPFSAFFLKAEQSITIPVGMTEENPESIALSVLFPLNGTKTEPSVDMATGNRDVADNAVYRMENHFFRIINATEKGTVTVVDAIGRRVSAHKFNTGESKQIQLPGLPGAYILIVQTQNRRGEYKFIR